MIPNKQKNLHSKFFGLVGDCWRTAISCILEMQPEEVPNFAEGEFPVEDARAWLEHRGYGLARIPFMFDGSPEAAAEFFGHEQSGVYWMLSGTTQNGGYHVVICHGGKIVHDPAISNGGISGPENKVYWAMFITVS